MRVVEEYPNFSAIEYADYFSSLFSYKDISWYTRDLQQYLTRKVKFKLMGTTKGPRDILNIEEFEFLESHDLAEYLSCIIYYKLKSYEQFQNSAQLSFHQYTLRDAMCFYPVALNRFALNRFYSFKGHIENCFKKKSYRGNEYAHILIKDETRKVFKAVVRTENFFKLLNGLNEMRKHNCDIEIYGKVVKDKFKDEIILDVERFTLIINGNLFTYPSKI